MATNAEILAAVSSGDTLALTPLNMVTLLDRLIAEAVVDNKSVVNYTINGRSVSRSLTEARQLREYYHNQHIAINGAIATASCEMTGI